MGGFEHGSRSFALALEDRHGKAGIRTCRCLVAFPLPALLVLFCVLATTKFVVWTRRSRREMRPNEITAGEFFSSPLYFLFYFFNFFSPSFGCCF